MARPERLLRGLKAPLASRTLGSPFGRPPSPLRGAVVELGLFYVGSSINYAEWLTPIDGSQVLTKCAPGEIRTPDLLVRSQALYPTELRAH
jgi:hypothetical protein